MLISENTQTFAYRPDVDGLRAIAVLSVVGYHYDFQLVASGFLGVDVFFVISGFVITKSLQERRASSLKEFLVLFWTRRVKRLFPALINVVVLSTCLAWTVGSASSAKFTGITGLSALAGMSNLYFYRNSVDYWGTGVELNFLTQSWSLGVEEQFYFFLPLLLYIFGLAGVGRNTSKTLRNIGRHALELLTLLSLVGFLLLASNRPEAVFYLSPFRFWELGVGVLLCISSPVRQLNLRLSSAIATVSMVLLLLSLSTYVSEGSARLQVLTATLCTAMLILFSPHSFVIQRVLTARPMLYIGRISYSLYLWHWTVLVLFKWMAPLASASRFVALAISFVLAHLSYRLLELPLRSRKWKLVGDSELLTGLLVIGVTIALLGASIPIAARAKNDPWRGVQMVHNELRCHAPKWTKTPLTDCLLVPDTRLPTMYVLGDSNAGNLIPSLTAAFPNVQLRYLTDSELSLAMSRDQLMPTTASRLSELLDFIQTHVGYPDVIIMAFSRDTFSYTQRTNQAVGSIDYSIGSPRTFDPAAKSNLNFELALGEIAKQTQRVGAKLVLFDGLPKLCSHVQYDVGKSRHPENPCTGRSADSLTDRAGSSAMLHRVAKKFQAEVVDAHSYLCPEADCQSVFGGKLWTWDASPHFVNINDQVLSPFFSNVGRYWFNRPND